MLRPFRLLVMAGLVALVYFGFFSIPGGARDAAAFDPDVLAAREVDVWKAAKARDDFATYISVVQMLREQQRYNWFRAVQAGYYLSEATGEFAGLTTRFERVLPDLEAAATIERDWRGASYRPNEVARAQLDWWVTLRRPNLTSNTDVPRLVAEDYGLRYGVDASEMEESAAFRTEAVKLRDSSRNDPDWPTITKLLAKSNRSLRAALERAAKRAASRRQMTGDMQLGVRPL